METYVSAGALAVLILPPALLLCLHFYSTIHFPLSFWLARVCWRKPVTPKISRKSWQSKESQKSRIQQTVLGSSNTFGAPTQCNIHLTQTFSHWKYNRIVKKQFALFLLQSVGPSNCSVSSLYFHSAEDTPNTTERPQKRQCSLYMFNIKDKRTRHSIASSTSPPTPSPYL